MNDEELRAMLSSAKSYKAARIADAEREVKEARHRLSEAEARLATWTEMIPFEVQEILAKEARHEEDRRDEDERAAYLSAKHTAALKEAYERKKGILPPEASSKSTSFGIGGAIFLGAAAAYFAYSLLHLRSEFGLLLIASVGGVLGFFVGLAFFNANFVVDESLERGIFARFTASDTVRRTYFKNTQD